MLIIYTGIIILFFIFIFCLPVLIARIRYSQPEKPNFVLANPNTVPHDVTFFFNKTTEALKEDGFNKLMDIAEGSGLKYIRYFVNRKAGHTAIAVSQFRRKKFITSYLEFRTLFTSWDSTKYKVVFSGYITGGLSSSIVKKRLSHVLRRDISKMEHLLSGRPVETKGNLSRSLADKFKIKFEKAGADCSIKEVNKNKEDPEVDEILTTNNQVDPVFQDESEKKIVQKSEIKNPNHLYEHHKKFAKKIGKDARNIVPSMGEEITHIKEVMEKELQAIEKQGIIFLNKKKKYYKYTWKGAYSATWGSIFKSKNSGKKMKGSAVVAKKTLSKD